MSDYVVVPLSALSATADAIKEKLGTQEDIEFTTNGFKDAVDEIEVGSSGSPLSANAITLVAENQSVYPTTGYASQIQTSKLPVLTNNWDFTKSLTDSVGGLNATLANGATIDSEGLHITGSTQYAKFPLSWSAYKTYEIDIVSHTKTFTSGHGRLFMITGSHGLIWYSGGYWSIYFDGSWSGSSGTSSLNGTTIVVKSVPIVRYINGSKSTYIKPRINKGTNPWIWPPQGSTAQTTNITIGAASASYYDMTISGFRVYDGISFDDGAL